MVNIIIYYSVDQYTYVGNIHNMATIILMSLSWPQLFITDQVGHTDILFTLYIDRRIISVHACNYEPWTLLLLGCKIMSSV